MKRDVDVIVIGGGHAGAEAAHAAARLGVRVALVTHDLARIGEMSCNPAIGGLGKGHLVREIDALDGVMGRVADRAGIQFRLLNRRKGPAVQGPRAQCDRALYRTAMQAELAAAPGLSQVAGEVVDLRLARDRVAGVTLADGSEIRAPAVVLTTGTFLRGAIHLGDRVIAGGRLHERAAVPLAERIEALGLPLGRLKTGTPPRLDGTTIDWARLTPQPGDADPVMFSFLSRAPSARQLPCHLTRTTERTHEIIRADIHRSAMRGGAIEGAGPRYCPSVEDKVTRFADKASHQVFLEPEGLADDTVYPNGISTSLPEEVQARLVASIPGLERARIRQWGYAIEYDYVDPRSLDHGLAVSGLPGLYLAGQINGTTGYEEAAAQGLMAGLNAAAAVRGASPIRLSRADGYIGVLVDDLITRGVSEPYRMFTSRAEYRLTLRADNADARLTPRGVEIGCVGSARRAAAERKRDALEAGEALARSLTALPEALHRHGIPASRDGMRRTAWEMLGRGIAAETLAGLWPELGGVDAQTRVQLAIESRYESYVQRQAADISDLQREQAQPLPEALDYREISGLSAELQEKLAMARPRTLGQASNIEGMTSAALTLLLLEARRTGAGRKASA